MQEQTVLPGFTRRSQVGFTVIGFEKEMETLFLKIMAKGVFQKRDGKNLDYVDVINLVSGEEGRMWLDGGLKYNLKQVIDAGKSTDPFPVCVEVQWLGKKLTTIEIDGDDTETMVNQYKMWVIDEEEAKSNS